MRRAWVSLCLGALASACGNDIGQRPDAPPAGTPIVMLSAPRTNEAFYMTQTVQVLWTVSDDGTSLTCDVVATDGSMTLPIAANVATTSGAAMMTPWTLTSVPVAATYRVEVSCADDSSPPLTGSAISGTFAVSGPPQPVSYASQVQPIWTARCISSACHDSVMPQERLNLTASASRAALVGISSRQCSSTQLVNPGMPNQSYLMFKLQGSGPCMTGSRMPKGSSALSAAQLQIVRDWIANGAPNN